MHDHLDDHDHPVQGGDEPPDAAELEQLARSLSMDGSLGRRDAQRVASVLRGVASRRRHPTGRT